MMKEDPDFYGLTFDSYKIKNFNVLEYENMHLGTEAEEMQFLQTIIQEAERLGLTSVVENLRDELNELIRNADQPPEEDT